MGYAALHPSYCLVQARIFRDAAHTIILDNRTLVLYSAQHARSVPIAMTDYNSKDAEYLSRLQDYYADWKSIPSYASLCEVFGISSKSWVKTILSRLSEAGFIERTPDGIWVPTRQFFARPLAESAVPAGMPVSVTPNVSEYSSLIWG